MVKLFCNTFIALVLLAACSAPTNQAPSVSPKPTTALPTKPAVPTALPPSATSTRAFTSTAKPTPSATATIDFASYKNKWTVYHNEKYGYSFEYPAIYDEKRFYCATPEPDAESITIGGRSDLFVISSSQSLEGHVNDIVRQYESDHWKLSNQLSHKIDSLDAITIEYRFGGLSRYGTASFVKYSEYIYAFNYTAGASCYIPGFELWEDDAYEHMIDTFRVDR